MVDQNPRKDGVGASKAPDWLLDPLQEVIGDAAHRAEHKADAYDPTAGGEFIIMGEVAPVDEAATNPGFMPPRSAPTPATPPSSNPPKPVVTVMPSPVLPEPEIAPSQPVCPQVGGGQREFFTDEGEGAAPAPSRQYVPPKDAGREPTPNGSMIGIEVEGIRPVSRADQESMADDPIFRKFSYRLSETSMFAVKVARMAWVVAAFGWIGFFVSTFYLFRLSKELVAFRFPYVRSDATGDVQLVQAVPEIASAGEYPDAVVLNVVSEFYQGYYGISSYHQRETWPRLKIYWLTQPQGELFAQFAQERIKEAQKEQILRRVSIRTRLIDEKNPVKADGGGVRYLARVEFVEEDISLETQMVKRKRLYQSKIIFTLGATFKEISPDAKKLLAVQNPLNFQLLEMTTPDPIFLDIQSNRPLDAKDAAPSDGESPIVPPVAQ